MSGVWIWFPVAATALILVYPLLSWLGSRANWMRHPGGQLGYLGDLALMSAPNIVLVLGLDLDVLIRPPGAMPLLLIGAAILAAVVLRFVRLVLPLFQTARSRLMRARVAEMPA